MTSIMQIGQIASGYGDAMNTFASQLADPDISQDPARLAEFQINFQNMVTAYQMVAQTAQTLQRQDQQLIELLRSAAG